MDVHLMIEEPETYLERFVKSGSDYLTFHIEATQKVDHCIELIRKAGAKVGISIKPATDVEVLRPYLPLIDMVLVMSVEPGFGGQKFMPVAIDKVRSLRAMAGELSTDLLIEVDGGIGASNAGILFEAGADALVAGNSVFGASDPEAEIAKILRA
ncbi:MAG: ribulose-phosphate 3-epimerase, partial [Rikenellaceae bacterium]